jgi:hypothetical protein
LAVSSGTDPIHLAGMTALATITAITATTEMITAINSNSAFVDDALRLWLLMSNIAATQRATIAKVSKGHKAYDKAEGTEVTMVALEDRHPRDDVYGRLHKRLVRCLESR